MHQNILSRKYPLIGLVLVIAIVVGSAGVYVIAFPAEETVYSIDNAPVEPAPTYYRFSLRISQSSLLYLRYNLVSLSGEGDFSKFSWEMYNCDLQTFDGNFLFGDEDGMVEFRSDCFRRGGGVHVENYEGFLGDEGLEGNYVFVWWLTSQTGSPNWAFSMSLSLRAE